MGNIKDQMKKRLAGRKFTDKQMDVWLQEDLTAEYDRIVAARKRHAAIRRWAVAASILLIVGVGTLFFMNMSLGEFGSSGVQECRRRAVERRRKMPDTQNVAPLLEGLGRSHSSSLIPHPEQSVGVESMVASSTQGDELEGASCSFTQKAPLGEVGGGFINDSLAKVEKVRQVLAAMQQRAMEIDDSIDRKHIYDYIMSDEKLYNMGQKILCENCPIDFEVDEL